MFKKIVLYTILSLVLLAGAGILLVHIYSDEIKQAIISELNKKLAVDIAAEEINFTLFARFPDASIELQDVSILSSGNLNKEDFDVNADTLLHARRLYLQFNLIDLYYKEYRMQQITLQDYDLRIYIDNAWENNFQVLKPDSSTSTTVEFALDKVLLENGRISYNQADKGLAIHSSQKELILSGNFAAERYTMNIRMDGRLDSMQMDRIPYAGDLDLETEMELIVAGNEYKINQGRLRTQDMLFELHGTLTNADTATVMLHAQGKDLDINSFVSLLPPSVRAYTGTYRSSGTFYFEADVSGPIGNGLRPEISAGFGIKNGRLSKSGSRYQIQNLQFEGVYTNGYNRDAHSSLLSISQFSFETKSSRAEGKLEVRDFVRPHIKLEAALEGKLEELASFVKLDQVETIKGDIEASIKFDGRTREAGRFTADDYRRSTTIGKLKLDHSELKLKDMPGTYTLDKGRLTFNSNSLRIESLELQSGKNDLELKGTLKNFVSWLLSGKDRLDARLIAKSKHLRIEELIPTEKKGGKEKSELSFDKLFPEHISYDIDLEAEDFKLWSFQANQLSARLYYSPRKLTVTNLHMNTMGGKISGQAALALSGNGGLRVQARHELTNIDVRKMFLSFNNFSQDYITDKNLKGTLDAQGSFAVEFMPDLSPDMPGIEVKSTIRIDKGELINFAPMEALSEYIELEELRHIRFKTLKNEITIKDQMIYLPYMDIKSSVANISLAGTHSFDNVVDYSLKAYLQDFVGTPKLDPELAGQGYYIERTDDKEKTSLFLTMKGPIDDLSISYDTKTASKHMGKSLKEEGQEALRILQEEFGLSAEDERGGKEKTKAKGPEGSRRNKTEEDNEVKSGFVIEFGEEKPNPDEQ